MLPHPTQIRIPVLFSAGFLYYVFWIYLHDWSIDSDAWAMLHSARVLLNEGVFIAESNKLLVNLVSLIPAFLDSPALFPLITAAVGSVACLALYEIVLGLTRHRGYALAGWGIVLLSPMMTWLVLACNSIVYATCFVLISLCFFMRSDTQKGTTFLVLAALSRPEPFLLIVFAAVYLYVQWKNKALPTVRFLIALALLALPPILWMVANFHKMGNVFYSLERAQTYTLKTGQNYSWIEFPGRLFYLLASNYFNFLALALSIAGVLYFFKRIRSMGFLYGYLILSTLFYWALAPFNMPLLHRYLLPVSIYLVIFGILMFKELADKWAPPSPTRGKTFSLSAFLPLVCLLLFIHLSAQSAVDRIILFHKNFDKDIPIVADQLRQRLSSEDPRPITVMASLRRIPHLKFLLYEYRSHLTFVAVRNVYFRKTNLSKEKVDWIVLAPDDFIPRKSARYSVHLMSSEELKKQEMHMEERITLSKRTQMVRLSR